MLFYLKKIISYALEPFSILVICLFVSWYLIDKKYIKTKLILFFVIVSLLLSSTSYFSNKAVIYWTSGYNPIAYDNSNDSANNASALLGTNTNVAIINTSLDTSTNTSKLVNTTLNANTYSNINSNLQNYYIVILGGYSKKRTWEGVRLFYELDKLHNITIITTGYKQTTNKTKKLLISANILQRQIVVFDKPQTTYEEANKIKQFLGNKEFILVTSSYHMRRASAIFDSHNLNFTTSSFKDIDIEDDLLFVPRLIYLSNSSKILHEFFGLGFLKVREFIKQIF